MVYTSFRIFASIELASSRRPRYSGMRESGAGVTFANVEISCDKLAGSSGDRVGVDPARGLRVGIEERSRDDGI